MSLFGSKCTNKNFSQQHHATETISFASLSLSTFSFFALLGKPDLELALLHSQTLSVHVLSDDQAQITIIILNCFTKMSTT